MSGLSAMGTTGYVRTLRTESAAGRVEEYLAVDRVAAPRPRDRVLAVWDGRAAVVRRAALPAGALVVGVVTRRRLVRVVDLV